jgi:hypothetical protein
MQKLGCAKDSDVSLIVPQPTASTPSSVWMLRNPRADSYKEESWTAAERVLRERRAAEEAQLRFAIASHHRQILTRNPCGLTGKLLRR